MQRHKRRQYTEACKREAVRLVTDSGDGVREAARTLGIKTTMFGRWKRQAERPSHGRHGGNGHVSAEQEALQRFRTEHQRLRLERDL